MPKITGAAYLCSKLIKWTIISSQSKPRRQRSQGVSDGGVFSQLKWWKFNYRGERTCLSVGGCHVMVGTCSAIWFNLVTDLHCEPAAVTKWHTCKIVPSRVVCSLWKKIRSPLRINTWLQPVDSVSVQRICKKNYQIYTEWNLSAVFSRVFPTPKTVTSWGLGLAGPISARLTLAIMFPSEHCITWHQ